MTLRYKGNQLLKSAGAQIEFTSEHIDEWIKCALDPIYFIENYLKIVDADGEEVPLKLYPYQKDIVLSIHENRFTITACARRSGKSTATNAYIIWYILFNKNKLVVLLANKGDTAREQLGRIQFSYEKLPHWIQQGVGKWNEGSLELENGSRVLATTTTSDSIRGYGPQLVFIDEAAHIDNWDEFQAATLPTITRGKKTKLILVSTPYGLNHFYDIWQNSDYNPKVAGTDAWNGYHAIKVTWKDAGYGEEWRQTTLAMMNFDLVKFDQEYNVEFLGSSGTLISGAKLQQLRSAIPIQYNNQMSMYESPEKDHMYICFVDVSRGKGLDYSTIQIIDVTQMPYKQVYVFRDNLCSPIELAETTFHIAKSYNNAGVLVEVNDIGGQVADSLFHDYEYDHILYTENAGRMGKKVTNRAVKSERGIRTTKTVKNVGCSLLKLLIEQDKLIINDKQTIDELKTFSKKNTSYEAETGKHDDLVMPLVLFAWFTDQDYMKDLTNINTLASLREKTELELMDDLCPFGFIDDGNPGKPIENTTQIPLEYQWMFDDDNKF